MDWFFTENATGTITIGGLDNSQLYTLDVFGSRKVTTGPRVTTFTLGSDVRTLEIGGANSGTGETRNNDDFSTFSNISPTSGIITFTVSNTSGASGADGQYGYINAMRVTTIPEPSAAALLLLGVAGFISRRRR